MSQILVITQLTGEDVALYPNLRSSMRNVVDIIAPSMIDERRHALAMHLAAEIGQSRVNMLSPSLFMEPVEARFSWVIAPLPAGICLEGLRNILDVVSAGTAPSQREIMALAARVYEDQIAINDQTTNLVRRALNFLVYVNSKLSERRDGLGLMIKNVGTVEDCWVLMANFQG